VNAKSNRDRNHRGEAICSAANVIESRVPRSVARFDTLIAIACIPVVLISYEAWTCNAELSDLDRVGYRVLAYLLAALCLATSAGIAFVFHRSNSGLRRSNGSDRRLFGMKASDARTVAAVLVAARLATVLYYAPPEESLGLTFRYAGVPPAGFGGSGRDARAPLYSNRLTVDPDVPLDIARARDWYESQHERVSKESREELEAVLRRVESNPRGAPFLHFIAFRWLLRWLFRWMSYSIRRRSWPWVGKAKRVDINCSTVNRCLTAKVNKFTCSSARGPNR